MTGNSAIRFCLKGIVPPFFIKALPSFADNVYMDTLIVRGVEKAITERRKQYLALHYQILKSDKDGRTPPKDTIDQAIKIRTSHVISKEQACLN